MDHLNAVSDWANGSLPLPPLETNDDYMTLAMEVMNNSYYLLRIAASLTSSYLHAEKGVTKRGAIVLGHLVRIAKLYDALRYHTAKKRVTFVRSSVACSSRLRQRLSTHEGQKRELPQFCLT